MNDLSPVRSAAIVLLCSLLAFGPVRSHGAVADTGQVPVPAMIDQLSAGASSK